MLSPADALGDITDQMASDLWDQFATYVAESRRVPRFLYLNQRFWEDAPQKLRDTVALLDVQVRTSKLMPYDGAFLTRDEFPPDDLAKSLAAGEKIGLI
jgi:hypothetical protein